MSSDPIEAFFESEDRTPEKLLGILKKNAEAESNPESQPSQLDPVDTETAAKSLLALVIGINEYNNKPEDWKKLNGAVRDAQAVQKFLIDVVGVPEKNITLLLDQDATRERIEHELSALGDKPGEKGVPVVIYYAGHGAEVAPPPNWKARGDRSQIQMLVPVDAILKVPDGTDESKRFQGILDITLAHKLSELAEKKGDNITLILDCCHSTSASRNQPLLMTEDSRYVTFPEGYELIPPSEIREVKKEWLPESSDGTRGSYVADGFLAAGMRSHVVMSACGHSELSLETRTYPKRGRFTVELLKILSKPDALTQLAYSDITSQIVFPIDKVSKKSQVPQCEGAARDNIIFSGKLGKRRQAFPVTRPKPDLPLFIIHASEWNGVSPGAKFTVYDDPQLLKPLGTLEVKSSAGSKSTAILAHKESITFSGGFGYAVKVKTGQSPDVRVYVPLEMTLMPVWEVISDSLGQPALVEDLVLKFVEDEDTADVIVSLKDEEQAAFSFVRQVNSSDGITRTRIDLEKSFSIEEDPERIYHVLYEAAHFYYHLHHTNTSGNKLNDKKQIYIEGYEMSDDDSDFQGIEDGQKWHRKPIGPNLINKDNKMTPGLYDSVTGKPVYGFDIKNTLPTGVYASVFDFDFENLTIDEIFGSCTANPMGALPDVSIPRMSNGEPGSLTIGYGSGGAGPRQYGIGGKGDIAYDVLKAYLSLVPLDTSKIKRPLNPFTCDLPSNPSRGRGSGEAPRNEVELMNETLRLEEELLGEWQSEQWDTISVNIDIVRGQPSEESSNECIVPDSVFLTTMRL